MDSRQDPLVALVLAESKRQLTDLEAAVTALEWRRLHHEGIRDLGAKAAQILGADADRRCEPRDVIRFVGLLVAEGSTGRAAQFVASVPVLSERIDALLGPDFNGQLFAELLKELVAIAEFKYK